MYRSSSRICDLLNYVRNLRFEDKLNYGSLPKVFRNLYLRRGFKYDIFFDWTILEFQRTAEDVAETRAPSSVDKKT